MKKFAYICSCGFKSVFLSPKKVYFCASCETMQGTKEQD